jgi:hypothetical protein
MFIPRHPVVENQFCSYAAQTSTATGVGGVLCYAGAVLYLDASATNQEAIVKRYDTFALEPTNADERVPFGFSMQKVKTGYHQVHPAGFMMPGDLGSSDVIAQPSYSSGAINGTKEAPVGVAHLGIWDTVHYTTDFTGDHTAGAAVCAAVTPGDFFRVAANLESMISTSTTDAADATKDGQVLPNVTTNVARCVKGVSAAKCSANMNNTTLYPIRIKLLV